MNLMQQALVTVSHLFNPAVQSNPTPVYLVASFVAANLGMYLFTRGKEFVIGSFASAAFLMPFLNV